MGGDWGPVRLTKLGSRLENQRGLQKVESDFGGRKIQANEIKKWASVACAKDLDSTTLSKRSNYLLRMLGKGSSDISTANLAMHWQTQCQIAVGS